MSVRLDKTSEALAGLAQKAGHGVLFFDNNPGLPQVYPEVKSGKIKRNPKFSFR